MLNIFVGREEMVWFPYTILCLFSIFLDNKCKYHKLYISTGIYITGIVIAISEINKNKHYGSIAEAIFVPYRSQELSRNWAMILTKLVTRN